MVNDKLKQYELAKICQKYSSYGWTVAECEEAIRIVTEAIRDSLLERHSVTLRGLGTLTTVVGDKNGTRIGRNPKKPNEEVFIKKRVRPRIIWSKQFKNEFKV